LRRISHLSEVLVLSVDPGLAEDMAPSRRRQAEQASAAPVRVASVGRWEFEPNPDPTALGVLILRGMVVLRIGFAGSTHLELVGAGDVLNPWSISTETSLQAQASVHVVRSGGVAVLDRRFVERMTPWPEVIAALMRRHIRRIRRMAVQASILSLPRVDERLEYTLWRLAEQFGSMTREGLHVRLPFTHRELAEMIAARRSTVTLAVNRLVAEDRVRRPGRNQWLLPHHELTRLRAPVADESELAIAL
jgi:CRP/FNR family transcriptional regulator, cyclic AMP receptor protein